ncbi:MAG: hypothetical protein WA406_20530, partial [Pseudolabrys sp.]
MLRKTHRLLCSISGDALVNLHETATTATETAAPADERLRSRLSLPSGVSRGLLTIASLALAFLIWQFLSSVLFNPFLIPPPLEVIRTAIPMLMSGEILGDVTISMTRILVGFVTGSLIGVVAGVLLGRIRLLHDLLDPIIE